MRDPRQVYRADLHRDIRRGGLVPSIAQTHNHRVIARGGGEVSGDNTGGGVDRQARGAVCIPSISRIASNRRQSHWRDGGVLITDNRTGAVDAEPVRLDGDRDRLHGRIRERRSGRGIIEVVPHGERDIEVSGGRRRAADRACGGVEAQPWRERAGIGRVAVVSRSTAGCREIGRVSDRHLAARWSWIDRPYKRRHRFDGESEGAVGCIFRRSRIASSNRKVRSACSGRTAADHAGGGVQRESRWKRAAIGQDKCVGWLSFGDAQVLSVGEGDFGIRQGGGSLPLELGGQDRYRDRHRGGLGFIVCHSDVRCVVARSGGKVARDDAGGGVDRERGRQACRGPFIGSRTARGAVGGGRDGGELLAADRGAAIHGHAIRRDSEREGAELRHHGIAAVAGIHGECVVALGGGTRRAGETACRGV